MIEWGWTQTATKSLAASCSHVSSLAHDTFWVTLGIERQGVLLTEQAQVLKISILISFFDQGVAEMPVSQLFLEYLSPSCETQVKWMEKRWEMWHDMDVYKCETALRCSGNINGC